MLRRQRTRLLILGVTSHFAGVMTMMGCSLDPSIRPEHRALEPADAAEVRAQFRRIHAAVRQGTRDLTPLSTEAIFVFVPGYRMGAPAKYTLVRAKATMRKQGLHVVDVVTRSFGESERNAFQIRDAMEQIQNQARERNTDPEIVMIGQSKGMLDILYYLNLGDPSARGVRAVIGITPATQGSPLARLPPFQFLPGIGSMNSRRLVKFLPPDGELRLPDGITVMTVSAQPLLGFMDPMSILAIPIHWRAINSITLIPFQLILLPFGMNDGLVFKASTYLPGHYDLGAVRGDHALAFTRRQQIWTVEACIRLLLARGVISGAG